MVKTIVIKKEEQKDKYKKVTTLTEEQKFHYIYTYRWAENNWDIPDLLNIRGLDKYVVYNEEQNAFGAFAMKEFNFKEGALSEEVFKFRKVPQLQVPEKRIVELDCFSILPQYSGMKSLVDVSTSIIQICADEKIDILFGLIEKKLYSALKRQFREGIVKITEETVIDKADGAEWTPFMIYCEKLFERIEKIKIFDEKRLNNTKQLSRV